MLFKIDHNAHVIQPGEKLLFHSSILYAELAAAWPGIQVAVHHLKEPHFWLEGDPL